MRLCAATPFEVIGFWSFAYHIGIGPRLAVDARLDTFQRMRVGVVVNDHPRRGTSITTTVYLVIVPAVVI